MFKVGDKVAITEAYGEDEYTGLTGTVVYVSNDTWPYEVDMDVVPGLTDNELYRSALFDAEELRNA